MRLSKSMIVAGIAATAIAGVAIAGGAAERAHILNVTLPDGSIQQIRYAGDVAPQVMLVRAPQPIALFDPFDDAPFAALEHASLAIRAHMDSMLRQADAAAGQSPALPGVTLATFGNAPAGTVSYSYVSSSSSNGATCSRSVQMVSMGAGQQPKVTQQASGDCAPGGHAAPQPVAAPAPGATKLIPAKLDQAAKPATLTSRT